MQTPLAQHVFIIAEIGINHNGDLRIAKELMAMAKRVGCDAVKFQKRTVDVVYSSDVLARPRESPWGVTERDQKMGLEFGLDEYKAIDSYASEIGIVWSASAWDIDSQLFLRQFDVPFNKVASAMITHCEFLEVVATERKITYVSTGMCEIEDIEKAVRIFLANNCPIVLMHTTSTYPAAEGELNLSLIPYLSSRFELPVGYSGHEASVSPSIVAATLGAVAIERHITLDRSMYGSDQAASLEERGLRELVSVVRKIPMILGEPQKSFLESEKPVAEKLRYWL